VTHVRGGTHRPRAIQAHHSHIHTHSHVRITVTHTCAHTHTRADNSDTHTCTHAHVPELLAGDRADHEEGRAADKADRYKADRYERSAGVDKSTREEGREEKRRRKDDMDVGRDERPQRSTRGREEREERGSSRRR